jgi:hypothetical protein
VHNNSNDSRRQSHISPPPRARPSAAAAAHCDAAQVQVDAQAELKAIRATMQREFDELSSR